MQGKAACSRPAALARGPGLGSWLMQRSCFYIAALVMEPAHASNKFGGEFHAIGVYFKPPVIDLAQPGNNVRVPAWSLGEKDISAIVFYFYKTAEAAAVAELFPSPFIVSAFHHSRKPSPAFSMITVSLRNYFPLLFQSFCR
jgi:hypothetical protein